MADSQFADVTQRTLADLGVVLPSGGDVEVTTPIDGGVIARLPRHQADVDVAAERASTAFRVWREVPAPVRGQLVRAFADELRDHKDPLGRLVSLEAGKILSEGRGEVQEMIDICDFAVGLSRQLYGRTIASERPGHRMMETWHPLGPAAVITAFNFPVAVWAWNAALALVCGDPVVWKPSERTPLTALACKALLDRAGATVGDVPDDLVQVVTGGPDAAGRMADHPAFPLVSATGSTAMGRALGPRVAARFGRPLLELGGNNAMIVSAGADLDLAVRAVVFSAAGTAGQRCTSLRRLIVERPVHDQLVERVAKAYASLPIGNPLEDATLVGPLIDGRAYRAMQEAMHEATTDGGRV
ncbi:MAG: aldehyde dehydrogenase, partial [Actinomycetota bacterium]|nr:aldehyde dehydrogenase [Actinomycetota bacterium]